MTVKNEGSLRAPAEIKEEDSTSERFHAEAEAEDVLDDDPVDKPKTDILKKLPPYAVETAREDYYALFRIIRNAYGWSEDEAVLYLIASLRGPATKVLGHVPPSQAGDYLAITRALERRFGKSDTPEVYKARLKARKRRRGEPLPQLAQDIEDLTYKAFPSMAFMLSPHYVIDGLAKDYFIDALNDRELQLYVMQSHPTTIAQALTSAVELESFLQAATRGERSRDKAKGSSPENKDSSWNLKNLKGAYQRPEGPIVRARPVRVPERSQQSVAQEFTGTCWHCGERGYRQNRCPQGRTNSQGSRTAEGQGGGGQNRPRQSQTRQTREKQGSKRKRTSSLITVTATIGKRQRTDEGRLDLVSGALSATQKGAHRQNQAVTVNVEGTVDGRPCLMTMDTGAERTTVRPEMIKGDLGENTRQLCAVIFRNFHVPSLTSMNNFYLIVTTTTLFSVKISVSVTVILFLATLMLPLRHRYQ